MPVTLVNVSADSVQDFLDNAADKVGEGPNVLGVTKPDLKFKFTAVGGKITKIKFESTVTIKRAHWSGGKPDANNKKAIQEAEKLNTTHEGKHEKIAKDICAREFAAAEKALVGKSEQDANDALQAIVDKIDAAYKDLDKKEGMTKVTQNANGTFTVKQVGIP